MFAAFRRFVPSIAMSLLLAASVSAAEMRSPEGLWELEFRDSRFDVTFCGEQALCGELVWLSKSASTPEKTKYLGTLLIDHAKRTGQTTWKGQITLFGQTASGTIRYVSEDVIDLEGCKFGVLCRTYKLYRVAE